MAMSTAANEAPGLILDPAARMKRLAAEESDRVE